MNIDITPVIEALIALIAALVAGRLLPWLRERLGAERMAQLEAAYNVAAYAAEDLPGWPRRAEAGVRVRIPGGARL